MRLAAVMVDEVSAAVGGRNLLPTCRQRLGSLIPTARRPVSPCGSIVRRDVARGGCSAGAGRLIRCCLHNSPRKSATNRTRRVCAGWHRSQQEPHCSCRRRGLGRCTRCRRKLPVRLLRVMVNVKRCPVGRRLPFPPWQVRAQLTGLAIFSTHGRDVSLTVPVAAAAATCSLGARTAPEVCVCALGPSHLQGIAGLSSGVCAPAASSMHAGGEGHIRCLRSAQCMDINKM